jgi:hypothetical protein
VITIFQKEHKYKLRWLCQAEADRQAQDCAEGVPTGPLNHYCLTRLSSLIRNNKSNQAFDNVIARYEN